MFQENEKGSKRKELPESKIRPREADVLGQLGSTEHETKDACKEDQEDQGNMQSGSALARVWFNGNVSDEVGACLKQQ